MYSRRQIFLMTSYTPFLLRGGYFLVNDSHFASYYTYTAGRGLDLPATVEKNLDCNGNEENVFDCGLPGFDDVPRYSSQQYKWFGVKCEFYFN